MENLTLSEETKREQVMNQPKNMSENQLKYEDEFSSLIGEANKSCETYMDNNGIFYVVLGIEKRDEMAEKI